MTVSYCSLHIAVSCGRACSYCKITPHREAHRKCRRQLLRPRQRNHPTFLLSLSGAWLLAISRIARSFGCLLQKLASIGFCVNFIETEPRPPIRPEFDGGPSCNS